MVHSEIVANMRFEPILLNAVRGATKHATCTGKVVALARGLDHPNHARSAGPPW